MGRKLPLPTFSSLILMPSEGRKSEASAPERERTNRVYDVALDFSACKKEANEVASKLRTTLGLVYSRLQCIADAGQSLPQGGMLTNPQFYTILTDAITACSPTTRVSDVEAPDAVGLWRDVSVGSSRRVQPIPCRPWS